MLTAFGGPWLYLFQGKPLLGGSTTCILPTQCPLPGHLLQEALQADLSYVWPANLGPLLGGCRLTPSVLRRVTAGVRFNILALLSWGFGVLLFSDTWKVTWFFQLSWTDKASCKNKCI